MKLPAIFLTIIVLNASHGVSQDLPATTKSAIEAVGKLEPQIRHLSLELWKYSETALREHKCLCL